MNRITALAACVAMGGCSATARTAGVDMERDREDPALVRQVASVPVDAPADAEPDATFATEAEIRAIVGSSRSPIDGSRDFNVTPSVAMQEAVDPNGDITTTEDGVQVISTTDPPVWCGPGEGGLCFPTRAECGRMQRGGCSAAKSHACFSFRKRTSGDEVMRCTREYRLCRVLRDALAGAPDDFIEVSWCGIWRQRDKVKR